MKIEEKLKNYRKSKKMSQADVAEAIGIAKTTYASYEQGKSVPNLDVIKKLCLLFHTSSDNFLFDDDDAVVIRYTKDDINDLKAIQKKWNDKLNEIISMDDINKNIK